MWLDLYKKGLLTLLHTFNILLVLIWLQTISLDSNLATFYYSNIKFIIHAQTAWWLIKFEKLDWNQNVWKTLYKSDHTVTHVHIHTACTHSINFILNIFEIEQKTLRSLKMGVLKVFQIYIQHFTNICIIHIKQKCLNI